MLRTARPVFRGFTRGFHVSVRAMNETKPKLGLSQAKIYTFEDVAKLVAHPSKDTILVDVREPDELKQLGFIPSAINIPFKLTPGALNLPEDEFEDAFQFEKPLKDKELVFYCHAGVRSAAAEELAQTFGYDKRGNYEGSFADWLAKGGKVERK